MEPAAEHGNPEKTRQHVNVAGSKPRYPPKPFRQRPEKPAPRPGVGNAKKAGLNAGNRYPMPAQFADSHGAREGGQLA